MSVDLVLVGFGALFSAGGVGALAAATRRTQCAIDVAFFVLMALACLYLAAHSFLAGLPIA